MEFGKHKHLFETLERPALMPLPKERFPFYEEGKRRGMRIIQGLLALGRKHQAAEMEAACDTAWCSGGFRYRIVKELLKRRGAKQQTLEFIEAHPVIRPITEYGEFLKNALQGG